MASPVTNASIGMQQYENDDDDDTFWCTLGAMIQDLFEENIIPAALTMETSSETSVPPVKQSKLSMSLKKDKAGNTIE